MRVMTATDMRDKKGYPHRATGAEGQILTQPFTTLNCVRGAIGKRWDSFQLIDFATTFGHNSVPIFSSSPGDDVAHSFRLPPGD